MFGFFKKQPQNTGIASQSQTAIEGGEVNESLSSQEQSAEAVRVGVGGEVSDIRDAEPSVSQQAASQVSENEFPYSGAIGCEGIRHCVADESSATGVKLDPAMDGYLQQMTVDGNPVSTPPTDFD